MTRTRVPSTSPPPAPRAAVILAAVLPLLPGCDSILGPDQQTDPPIRTDIREYQLELWGENWLGAEISYTFENRTDGPVYIPNCQGTFFVRLDRLHRGHWGPAWAHAVTSCISPPIVIEAGETFSDTLRVLGGLPGTNAIPKWDRWEPSGTYRLVWTHALSSYDDEHPYDGPKIPFGLRVSNAFVLSR